MESEVAVVEKTTEATLPALAIVFKASKLPAILAAVSEMV